MARVLVLVYGALAYVVFLASFVAAIGFVADLRLLGIPWTLAGEGAEWMPALWIDAALLGLFALQHSVMARPAFKRRWTWVVPHVLERSTYVILASLILFAIVANWRHLPGSVWDVRGGALGTALAALSWVGWATVLLSTFWIDHFDLFGLRQVWDHYRGRAPRTHRFVEPGPYRFVRHPIMLGFLLAFWATPWMTAGHLLFAGLTTAYVLVAIRLEERDLVLLHGEAYEDYRRRVRALVPLPKARA